MADTGTWDRGHAAGRAAGASSAGGRVAVGRPGYAAPGVSVYSPARAAAIVARVAAGERLGGICDEPGQPHRTTVQNWTRAHPEFERALRGAQRERRLAVRRADREAVAALAALPGPVRGGSVSSYTPALGRAICARLENGETLTSIGRDPAMPCYGTVLAWVKRHPEFGDMYVEARATQGEFLFDEARDVAKAASPGTVTLARLQFDVIRWQAARLRPRKYLERLVVDEARAAAGAGAGPREVTFHVTHFERGPKGGVLCAPPRNAREAQAWVEAYGKPYESGLGPNGEMRPPMGRLDD